MELNTIAASFGALSTQLSKLHRNLLSRYPGATDIQVEQLPSQNAMNGLADGIAAAHRAFCAMHRLDDQRSLVVFVVQPGERNAFDQRWLQTSIWERHAARVVRMTLSEIAAHGKIDESGNMTYVSPCRMISLSYFHIRSPFLYSVCWHICFQTLKPTQFSSEYGLSKTTGETLSPQC